MPNAPITGSESFLTESGGLTGVVSMASVTVHILSSRVLSG